MRIDPKEAIAGYPAVLVRDTRRRLRVHLDWDLARLGIVAGFSAAESQEFVGAMVSAGLIERAGSGRWSVTPTGQTLSSATAAARVTRATGERALRELLGRVGRVNRDRRYLGKVCAVVLFGSMLKPEVDRPSDVDIAVEIAPKKPIVKKPARRTSAARGNGRRTATISEGCWTGNFAGIGRFLLT